jgi:hypothetical protein
VPKIAGSESRTLNISVLVDEEMKNALFRRARVEDRSVAAVCRRAFQAYVGVAPNGDSQTSRP